MQSLELERKCAPRSLIDKAQFVRKVIIAGWIGACLGPVGGHDPIPRNKVSTSQLLAAVSRKNSQMRSAGASKSFPPSRI